MRYTTIIDLTEFPTLYKNQTIRLVYLHLCLRSGYHDNDRDLVQMSVRSVAKEVGITIAAARHALHQLETFSLIQREGTMWKVRKFVVEQPITARAKTARAARAAEIKKVEIEEAERREAQRQAEEKERIKLAKQGKTSFMIYYEQMQEEANKGNVEAARWCKSNLEYYNQSAAAAKAIAAKH